MRLSVLFLVAAVVLIAGCSSSEGPVVVVDQHDSIGPEADDRIDAQVDDTADEVADESASGVNPHDAGFSLADVSVHSVEEDCWMAINGLVYDVTHYIAAHPGGRFIIEGCGTDATDLFETRPMGSGTPHSDRARGLLDDFLVGVLLQ